MRLILLLTIILFNIQSAFSQFHDTKGEVNVDGSGNVDFTLPIVVPSGIKEISPQITLKYLNSSNVGKAGYSWNLNGISSINRVSSRIDLDGYIDAINFNNDDQFSLDGQRLIKIDDNTFSTENYSNIKVQINNNNTLNPDFFIVYAANGSKSFYGNSINSKGISEWLITKWIDTNGNVINYEYIKDNNVINISKITWSENENFNTNYKNSIHFNYKTRLRADFAFLHGFNLINNKLLSSVVVNSGNDLFKKYEINHKSNELNYEIVDYIQEFNSNNEAANPVYFKYNTTDSGISKFTKILGNNQINSNSLIRATGDFDGDGKIDAIVKDKLFLNLYGDLEGNIEVNNFSINRQPVLSGSNKFETITGILENNKLYNKTYILTNSHKLIDSGNSISIKNNHEIYIDVHKLVNNNFQQFFRRTISYPYVGGYLTVDGTRCFNEQFRYAFAPSVRYLEGDFNGDGLSELLVLGSYNEIRIVPPRGSSSNFDQICDEVETEMFIPAFLVDMNPMISDQQASRSVSMSTSILNIHSNVFIFDFNGDGKQDLFYINDNGNYYVETLNKNGVNFDLLSSGNISEYNKIQNKTNLIFGDYNGDSKTDILMPIDKNSDQWALYLSTGIGFSKNIITLDNYVENGSGDTFSFKNIYYGLDVNSDGITDIVKVKLETHKAGKWDINNTDSYYEIECFSNIGSQDGLPNFNLTDTYHSGNNPRPFAGLPIVGDFRSAAANYQLMILKDNTNADTVLDVIKFNKNQQEDSRILEITESKGTLKHKFEYQRLDKNNSVYKSIVSENYPLYEYDVLPEIYVVSKYIFESDGDFKYKKFQYRGLTSHLHGIGILGFKKFAGTGWINDNINQDNPIWQVNEIDPHLKGSRIKSWTFQSNNLNLIDVIDDTQLLNKNNIEYRYETLPDLRTVILPINNADIDYVTGIESYKLFEYDSFYNIRKITETKRVQNETIVLNTSNIFENNNNLGNYYIGRLKTKNESIQAYGDSYNTETNFEYENNNLIRELKIFQNSGKSKKEYSYDQFGNILEVLDYGKYFTEHSNPRKISSKYDPSGRFVISKFDLDNFEEKLEYNNLGQITKMTDKFGVISKMYYDNWGKLIRQEIENDGPTTLITTYNYNRDNNGIKIEKNNLQTLDYSAQYFDVQGRNVKNTIKGFSNNQYVSTNIEFDFLGNKVRESEPYIGTVPTLWTSYEYDYLLRPIKQINPTGLVGINEYNGLEAISTEGVRSKLIKKDVLGNISKIVDNGSEVINHEYFAHGGIKNINYAGHVISTEYDVFGRKIYYLDPSVSSIPYTYEYDEFDQIVLEQTPETLTKISYDNSGRVLNKIVSGKSNFEINYTYNPDLKFLPVNEEGTIEGKYFRNNIFYNLWNKIIKNENITPYFTFTKTFGYDNVGRLKTASSSVNKEGYLLQNLVLENTYNTYNGELAAIKDITYGDANKVIWEVTYKDERGNATKQKLGNVIFVENEFDIYGNITNIRNRNENMWLSNKEYQYKVDRGLLIRRKDTHFNWEENFTYDEFDRLLAWTSPLGNNSNTYLSDGRIENNSQVGSYNYDSNAKYKKESIQLNSDGYNYYQNRSNQEITYDGFKRPLSIKEENRGSVDFEYGINNTRIKAVKQNFITNTTLTKYYAPDSSIEIVVDQDQNAKIVNYVGSPYNSPYIYLTNVNLDTGIKTNEDFYYLGRDFQGSITEIFTTDGQHTIERRLYDPWGNVTKLEDNIGFNYIEGTDAYLAFLDRGYTGHEHFNEVGIIHMNGRIYDPILKQFLSPDNFIQDPSNSQNYNRYGYAWNNPLKYTDPTGELFAEISVGASIGIAAAVGAFSYTMVALTTWTEFSALGLIKSTVIGAVSGAVSFGIGSLMQSMSVSICQGTSVLTQLQVDLIVGGTQAVLHGVSQGFINGVFGGDFGSSFVSAAVSSLVSSGVQLGGGASGIGNSGAATILLGTASGYLSAKLTGGNVWQAAATAFFVSALNHAAHKMSDDSMFDDEYDQQGRKVTKKSLGIKKGDSSETMIGKLMNRMKPGDYIDGGDLDFLNSNIGLILDKATMSSNGTLLLERTFAGRMAGVGADAKLTIKSQTLNDMKGYYFKLTGVSSTKIYTSGFVNDNKLYFYEEGKLFSKPIN